MADLGELVGGVFMGQHWSGPLHDYFQSPDPCAALDRVSAFDVICIAVDFQAAAALRDAGIHTVRDLVHFGDDRLKEVRAIGPSRSRQISAVLDLMGLDQHIRAAMRGKVSGFVVASDDIAPARRQHVA